MKIIFTLASLFFLYLQTFSQTCDCNIYPIPEICKKKCGIYILQKGNIEQLKKNLKVDDKVASQIVSISTRTRKKKLEDFQDDLSYSNYKKLETAYNAWEFQSNINQDHKGFGDNVGRDKNIYIFNDLNDALNSKEINVNKEKKLSLSRVIKLLSNSKFYCKQYEGGWLNLKFILNDRFEFKGILMLSSFATPSELPVKVSGIGRIVGSKFEVLNLSFDPYSSSYVRSLKMLSFDFDNNFKQFSFKVDYEEGYLIRDKHTLFLDFISN